MRTATKQEAINGNSNDTVITPLRLKQVLDSVDINPGEGGGGSGSDTPAYTAGAGISITNNVITNTITKTSQLTNDSNFITEEDLPDIDINDPVPINSIWDYEGDTVPDGFVEYTGEIDGEQYILPVASSSVLGGIKVGENLTIDEDGTLNATSSGKSSIDIYSTEETLIGVYENKPLYRKIVAVNQDFKDMDEISLLDLNIETLIHIGSFQTRNNEKRYLYDQFYDSTSRKFTPQFYNGRILFWVSETETYTATVWVEYTKTTDKEGTIVVPEGLTTIEETDPTVPDYVKAITEKDIAKWNSGTGGGDGGGDTLPINSIFAYEGDDIPEGYEEVKSTISNSNVYSKEETVVGTWIDGRPIYQKTLEFTTKTSDTRHYLRDLGITNVKNVWFDLSGSFVRYTQYTEVGVQGINTFLSTSDNRACYIDADQRLTIKNVGSVDLYWTITLRYTKTTD